MNRFTTLAAALLLAFPALAAAETWTNVPLIDVACSARSKIKANPDAHTRDCALACSKSGYGILTADGTYLKFDEGGNAKALAALNDSQKADHLRVTVTGDREGGSIKVTDLKL